MNPRGQIGSDEKSLILTAASLMLIVVVPVVFMTIFFAVRYRSTNKKAKFTPDWGHSRVIETIIWLVPAAIVAVLGTLAWTTSHRLDPFQPIASTQKPLTIQAVSLDWKWLFIYPDQQVASVNELEFPANTPVTFYVTSESVMNSFFIPQLGSQIYSMAGMQTQVHLIADHEGMFDGISANFSGPGFSDMKFRAIATSESGFQDWVTKARNSTDRLDMASYRTLAEPSEKHPVAYYSSVEPGLFQNIINQFRISHPTGMSQSTARPVAAASSSTKSAVAEAAQPTSSAAKE